MSSVAHTGDKMRWFVTVWLYLLAMTAVEVALGYSQVFGTLTMLMVLVVLSFGKAALIVAYFMHLRYEKATLVYSLIPAGLMVIALLFVFFPDSLRVLELRPQ